MAEELKVNYTLQTMKDYAKLHDFSRILHDLVNKGSIYKSISADFNGRLDSEISDEKGRVSVDSVSKFVKKYSNRYGHHFGLCSKMSTAELKRIGNYS